MGWARRAQTGRRPSQTPIGTQTRVANAISTTTRIRVNEPSINTCHRSLNRTSPDTLRTLVAWGRYAELFGYDEEAEQFSLEEVD